MKRATFLSVIAVIFHYIQTQFKFTNSFTNFLPVLREDNLEKKGQCTVYNIAQWLLYTLQFWGRLILEQMVTVPLFLAYIVIMLDLKLKIT